MNKQTIRGRLLASTIIGGAAFAAMASAPAFAADQPTTVEDVVVTGSRIKQPNLTTTSPVTSVGSAEVKLQGTQRVEDLVNNLPQTFAASASTLSNGTNGTATVDLRSFGCQRTLVMVDGRRLMPGSPSNNCADLNNVPAAMVDRVDVLTGGASAVYGSDALAGVVNFVMKKNFEGVQIDLNHSFNQHTNTNTYLQNAIAAHGYPVPGKEWTGGDSTDLNITMGANAPDGKGNLTAWMGYRNTKPVTQANFDYSACGFAAGNTNTSGGVAFAACGGSSTGVPGRIQSQIPKPGGPAGVFVANGPSLLLNGAAAGHLPGYSSAVNGFNFAPYNYFQRADERYTAGYSGHYQIAPAVDVYSQFMFMDDKTLAQIAPSGAFYGRVLSTNCNNPELTAAEVTDLCAGVAGPQQAYFLLGRRNVEGGPRQDNLEHNAYRFVLGARGDIDKTWSYDAYGQYGATNLSENYANDMSFTKIQRSLQVDPATGKCASVINGTDTSCVPWNIFGVNAVNQAALKYLITPAFSSAAAIQQVVSGSVTGKLGDYGIKSPAAAEGVSVVLGAEYRRESLDYRTDAEYQSGDLAGSGSPTLPGKGAYDVKEFFTELRIPLISDAPLAKDLSLNGAYRSSDYSNVGATSTYEVEANWTPIDDIRFRASFNRAVRVPSLREQVNPPHVGLDGTSDYCAGSLSATKLAQCAHDPFFIANPGLLGHVDRNPAGQYNGFVGGNPSVKPETGDTFSVGTVFTPSFIPGFNLTVDYFDIKVTNLIGGGTYGGGYGFANTQTNCYVNNISFFCNQIHRQPGSGSLWLGDGTVAGTGFITDTVVNTGALSSKGMDVQANYRLNLDAIGLANMGRIDFNIVGTNLMKLHTQPLSGALSALGTFDCQGLFGAQCTTPSPRWRHKFRATWNTPWNIQASVQWRYVGSTSLDAQSSFPALVQKIPAYNYFDLAASWAIRDNLDLHVGVNNVFDKDPPSPLQGATNGTTDPNVYDSMGRYFFMGLTAKF